MTIYLINLSFRIPSTKYPSKSTLRRTPSNYNLNNLVFQFTESEMGIII